MALRLAEGMDTARLEALGGTPLDGDLIDSFVAEGLLDRNGTRLTATASGRVVLERLILELAA